MKNKAVSPVDVAMCSLLTLEIMRGKIIMNLVSHLKDDAQKMKLLKTSLRMGKQARSIQREKNTLTT